MTKSKINWENEKENLIRYLEIDNLSLSKVGKIYGVSKDTVKRAAILLNIDINSQLNNKRKDVDWKKEDLEYYFFEKHLTTGQVAKIYKVSDHSVVLRAAKRLGIDTYKISSGYINITEDELVDLIFNKNFSLPDLIKYYNSSRLVINKFLKRYNIIKLSNGKFYKEGLKVKNNLPVPLKYTYVDNIFIRVRKGKDNDSIRYYYIPELGRWIRYSQINKRLKTLNIDDSAWVNKWIGRAKDPYNLTLEEAMRVVEFRYKDRMEKTKEYIVSKLLLDYSYKCDFFLLRDDIIEWIFAYSRNILIKNYIDFSQVPYKIKTKLSVFKIINLINNEIIEVTYRCLESDKNIIFNKYFGYNNINNDDILELSEYERKYLNKKYSLGELLTVRWLVENNIKYSDINTIYNINGRNSNLVRPDFIIKYITETIWIEYNGKQHYEKLEFFHHLDSDFNKQLIRDQNVRDYCKENNIFLIEIPYTLDTYEKVKYFLDKVILQGIDPNTLIDYKSLYKI